MLFQPTVVDVPEIARLIKQPKIYVYDCLTRCAISKDVDGSIVGFTSYTLHTTQNKVVEAVILDLFAKKELNGGGGKEFLIRELGMEFGRFQVKRIAADTTDRKLFEEFGFKVVSQSPKKNYFRMLKEISE